MRIVSLLTLALLVSGCSAFDDGESGEGLQVTAAFYPLQYAAEQVAGDHAAVSLLTQPGGDPHDLELSVAQTAEVTGADLVVHERNFQPTVDEAVDHNAEGAVLDAAEVVDLRLFGETEEEHGEEEHDHEQGAADPHFWHDPLRMAELGDALAAELAELDPGHTEDYRSNAEDFRSDMEALDDEFAAGLADCERTIVVTSHDAFSYLTKYGLTFESIAGLAPDAEATPAHLAELQQLIAEQGLTTVFTERLAPSAAGDTLAADLGLDSAVLDPIGGLDDETADEDYASLMASNLEALRTANGCR